MVMMNVDVEFSHENHLPCSIILWWDVIYEIAILDQIEYYGENSYEKYWNFAQ